MSFNSPPRNLGGADPKNGIATDGTSKYTPQFSAATQMILERIQSRNSGPFPPLDITTAAVPLPGYEDMRRSVLQSMRTTINMDLPATPPAGKRANPKPSRSASANGSRTTPTGASGSSAKGRGGARARMRNSGKRKRVKDESEDSDEDSDGSMSKLGGDSDLDDLDEVTEFPKITQSGRQIVKPAPFVPATYENPPKRRALSRKVREQALCKRCGRGHSPEQNQIVFCDGCNLPWHQRCHDPVISNAAVLDESSTWFCAECSRKRGLKSAADYEPSIKGPSSWAMKSMDEKRAHLNSLSHSQLVSLLLRATSIYPDICIFPAPAPAPARTTPSSGQPAPPPPSSGTPTAPTDPYGRLDGSPTQSATTHVPRGPAHAPNGTAARATNPPSQRPESRESTPASPPYPKPGNGLMADLGPDEEDLNWLVDGDDFEAFSHMVYEGGDAAAAAARDGGGPLVRGGGMGGGMGIGV